MMKTVSEEQRLRVLTWAAVGLLLFGSAATHAWWMVVAAAVLAGLGFAVLPRYRQRGVVAMALGVVIAAATVAILRMRA